MLDFGLNTSLPHVWKNRIEEQLHEANLTMVSIFLLVWFAQVGVAVFELILHERISNAIEEFDCWSFTL